MVCLLLCVFICFVSTIAGSPVSNLKDEIVYNRFQSVANSNYSVSFVNPQLCDPDVIQVCEKSI